MKYTNIILSIILLAGCSKESKTSEESKTTFPKIGKYYVVGIATQTPSNENTPISILPIQILEHGEGMWYRISFEHINSKNKQETMETWFNLDKATFISEKGIAPAGEIFPSY